MGHDLKVLRADAIPNAFIPLPDQPNGDPPASARFANRSAWRKGIGEIRREVRTGVDLRYFETPDFWASCRIGLRSHASVFALGAAWIGLSTVLPLPATVLAYPIVAMLIARQQRVLELLVHDGSHYSFSRKKRLNDWACDCIAALSVLQRTPRYRASHAIHHSQFGSSLDPCRDREAMKILRDSSGLPLRARVRDALRAFPVYVREYYGSVTALDMPTIARSVIWHLVLISVLSAALGTGGALAGWLMFWLAPFLLFLPWIRMNAEADEHDYDAGSEAGGTFTNKGGWNWLYHPAGDEYHMAHHCFPSVPIQRLARLDNEARRASPLYARSVVRRHR